MQQQQQKGLAENLLHLLGRSITKPLRNAAKG